MHTLANQHYLGKLKSKRPRPKWLDRIQKQPAHWSGPAQRYQESLIRLNEGMAQAINRAPAPFREVLAAMHAEILQLRRMVSEGVIRAMVDDRVWKIYEQVPVQVEDFVAISEATIQLFEELFRRGDLKADPEIRAVINDAVKCVREARKLIAA